MIPELNNFRRIDLLCNAMQKTGFSVGSINAVVATVKSMAKSPEQYEQWNRTLEPAEVDVIRSFFRPGGENLAKIAMDQFVTALAGHLEVTKDEFLRRAGLN